MNRLYEIEMLKDEIREADAIVIGAGEGLSTSAGFIYSGERFERYFFDFIKEYRIPDMSRGGLMALSMPPQVMWAYWSRHIYINRYMKIPVPVYDDLNRLIKDRDYFVITTNVDHCFQKAGFGKDRLFYTQGDYGLFQCSRPCHKKTYDNEDVVKEMILAQGFKIDEDGALLIPDRESLKMTVPEELIPYCPLCGEPMTLNLRSDDRFVEDECWHRAADRYEEFIREHEGNHVLYLELGVGGNTPMIIKYPFWKMTMENERAVFACINKGEVYAPEEIHDRSIGIDGDIAEVISEMVPV